MVQSVSTPSIINRITHLSIADAAWWPERFYLATAQAREAMYEVRSYFDFHAASKCGFDYLGSSGLRQQTRPHGRSSGFYREEGIF